jgi:hypothetical protein
MPPLFTTCRILRNVARWSERYGMPEFHPGMLRMELRRHAALKAQRRVRKRPRWVPSGIGRMRWRVS